MDIKNSAITAKMLIHSLLALLENENVDISSVKFKVGSDGNGYESPEFELEKLVSLAIDGLVEIEDAGAVPEGFVLVKMDDLELLRDSALKIKYASLSNDSDRIFSDIEDIQLSVERLIELQEPTND